MMIGCIVFAMYFMYWIITGDDLPKWLQVLNSITFCMSIVAAMIFWENHKLKVEKLEDELERLKESQDDKK